MKKFNLKYLLILLAVVVGFTLFFSSHSKTLAQTPSDNIITVETLGYSVVNLNTIIFTGDYFNNFDKKDFTTYFEYRKDDNNFDAGKEKTIEIKRPSTLKTTVDEAAIFYTSQEIKAFSTYYFRAVGYFNDKVDEKFYGETLSFDMTSNFITPYTYIGGMNGGIVSLIPPACSLSSGGACEIQKPSSASTGNGTTTVPVTCTPTQVLVDGECIDKLDAANNTDTSGSSNLVQCGTLRYAKGEMHDKNGKDMEGVIKNPCGFDDFIKLINNIVTFILVNIAVPLSAIMFAYAGFELLTSGGSTEKKSKAKSIFVNVAIGLALVAGAFVIVHTILVIAQYNTVGWNWFGLEKGL